MFIRFRERIDENDINRINDLVNEIGARYIVINITQLNYFSLEWLDQIIKYNNNILKEKKTLLMCDSSLRRNQIFKNIIPIIESELRAFSLI